MEKIVILGGGESGTGAAVLAKKKGLGVFVSDNGEIKEEYKKVLLQNEIEWEEGGHSENRVLNADEVVKSPGIPDNVPILEKLRGKGIRVISEIEFAGRYSNATMIGVTGTNGKTTTVHMVHHILQNAGLDVGLAGNVGDSLSGEVAKQDREVFVLELSSFQLDSTTDFKLDIGVLLNITPDHLDRYDNSMEQYVTAKLSILDLIKTGGAFVYCSDDSTIKSRINEKDHSVQFFPFSIREKVSEGAYIENDQLIININQNQTNMLLHELALQGKHNIYNSMASGIASRILEVRKDVIRNSLSDFQNIEHRLEYVISVHGIEFINDSKATNVNSTWYALESITKPVVWIAGGVDKGNDYEILQDLVKKKVKTIICIGSEKKANNKLRKAFSELVQSIHEVGSMDEAVKLAYQLGEKGDAALLSPACASFDRFKNYEERGWMFKKAVKEL
jgi:UDP-N-acetylmuramoylalanine--D-glutamate ligase